MERKTRLNGAPTRRLALGRRLSRLAGAAAALLALALSVAAAALGDTTPTSPPDSTYTPAPGAAPQGSWTQVGGAIFGQHAVPTDKPYVSATPYDVDLYTVSFYDTKNGFAGGGECQAPPPAGTPDVEAYVQTCVRVPVIYRYSNGADGPQWTQVYRGRTRGFVGAMSFISRDHVVAVGGTGTYPRREQPLSQTQIAACASHAGDSGANVDPLHPSGSLQSCWDEARAANDADVAGGGAGMARAWELQAGNGWQEMTSKLEPDMRAMTALDFSPRTGDCGAQAECGVAGGMQQLWMWRDGRFDKRIDNHSPSQDFDSNQASPLDGDLGTYSALQFRFRVRAVRFSPGANPAIPVFVGMSGCCAPSQSDNLARILYYFQGKWYLRPLFNLGSNGKAAPQTLPDSFYGLLPTFLGEAQYLSVVAAPGGPVSASEPDSRVVGPALVFQNGGHVLDIPFAEGVYTPIGTAGATTGNPTQLGAVTTDLFFEAATPSAGHVRLVAGDGDLAGVPRSTVGTAGGNVLAQGSPSAPDGLIDWAVGSLTSGAQAGAGVAYTSTAGVYGVNQPSPLDCPAGSGTSVAGATSGVSANCQAATPAQIQGQSHSKGLYALGSYALNGFVMVGDTGEGWAVGDRGALEHLGGQAGADAGGAQPAPPTLGAATQASFGDTGPYDAFRPLPTAAPGEVPALAARPSERLAKPAWMAAGSPDLTLSAFDPYEDISSIVMSRDGTEGWALGGGDWHLSSDQNRMTTFYHYSGSTWTRCDSTGVPGVLAADPACASLEPLRRYQRQHTLEPANFIAAARVPLEAGSDSSRANDFEVVAVGSAYSTAGHTEAPIVMRYRGGTWRIDQQAMKEIEAAAGPAHTQYQPLIDVAFTGPDDGWAIKGDGEILHYDHGRHWFRCQSGSTGGPEQAACNDLNGGLLPQRDPSAAAPPAPPHLSFSGGRLYLYGGRGSEAANQTPFIVSRASGPCTTASDAGCWGSEQIADGATTGSAIATMSVAPTADGHLDGWAVRLGSADTVDASGESKDQGLLHLTWDAQAKQQVWHQWTVPDSSSQYRLYSYGSKRRLRLAIDGGITPKLLTLSGAGAEAGRAFLVVINQNRLSNSIATVPPLTFDPAKGRWMPTETPFGSEPQGYLLSTATPKALAADNRGGAWLGVARFTGAQTDARGEQGSSWLFHYTPAVPKPVFEDVAHPVREVVTAAAPGPSGTLWVTTDSNAVYRYDRLTGWDRLQISGWDPGRLVTRGSEANAVAVGPDGQGIVVGKAGRIADIGPAGAALDSAAGLTGGACPTGGPCGTTRDLRSAAVAPDGSALAGGDARTLLWRPANGTFMPVGPPSMARNAAITGITMPAPDRAWLTTDVGGQVFAGRLSGGVWNWTLEDVTPANDPLTLIAGTRGKTLALHSIAIDTAGRGFAVGEGGVILERIGDGPRPWRRLSSAVPKTDLYSVVLAPGGVARGALIGGEYSLILTLNSGRWQVAHQGNPWDGVDSSALDFLSSRVRGLAVGPGVKAGQVEAWAAVQQPSDTGSNFAPYAGTLLHYSSDPSEPLLTPVLSRARPLVDKASPRAGELSLAALGKQDCGNGGGVCPDQTGTNAFNERVARTAAAEITGLDKQPGGPQLSIYTGDATNSAGSDATIDLPTDTSIKHQRWADSVAPAFLDAGMPLFGALGGQDLTDASAGVNNLTFASNSQNSKTGSNQLWRNALATMPAPWGSAAAGAKPPPDFAGLSFAPVTSSASESPTGGAHTHYALEIKRGDTKLARLIVLDTSLKALDHSSATQNPAESELTWLKDVLSSKAASEQAIVVSETPTYSYGPGQASDTLTDGSVVEALLSQYHVNLVVSGRLGWNALDWMTAPGVHTPCAGGSYPDQVKDFPAAGSKPCGQAAGASATPDAAGQLSSALQSTAAPVAAQCSGTGDNSTGVIPNVIAASAGGRFGPDGQAAGSADQGYWHGYTIIRLDKSGDPRCTIVEQRPVFDWVGVQAQTHVLKPGQHVTLKGYGREPVGIDQPIQYDTINGPAVTHRYDLLKADPQRPYLPDTNCPKTTDNPAGYCELSDSGVGTIDAVAGRITTGRGNHPRVYAIGLLSVGSKAAMWPMVFEPRRSFTAPPTSPIVIPSPPTIPQVHVAAIAATSPPPPPNAPPPAPPSVGTPTFPQLPGLPGLPPLNSPPPAAPPPPAGAPPPAPPASQAPSALSISVSPQSVGFAPPSGVVPPPAPPINPAPPGGARREAKAKQPAAAKSEEGSAGAETESSGGDMANSPASPPGTSGMTRRGPDQRPLAFTAVQRASQPSAWSRGALYGGGLVMMALLLALMSTALPTPRRRPPTVGAPAWARRRPPGR